MGWKIGSTNSSLGITMDIENNILAPFKGILSPWKSAINNDIGFSN